jgi:hypothetical protein
MNRTFGVMLHPTGSIFAGLCMAMLFSASGCASVDYASEGLQANTSVIVPAWAPPYSDTQFVRYYYLPDVEVYYDVWNGEFVYLHDGNWLFTTSFPQMYPGFDLYNCFVVVLDSRVYEPWMHHHIYVSHYPRYYYHSVYNVVDARELKGFDENREREIRLEHKELKRLDDASKTRREHEQVLPFARESRRSELTRPPQRVKYYGGDIGRRVKIEKHMMKPRGHDKKEK